jgi:hypothetical protein
VCSLRRHQGRSLCRLSLSRDTVHLHRPRQAERICQTFASQVRRARVSVLHPAKMPCGRLADTSCPDTGHRAHQPQEFPAIDFSTSAFTKSKHGERNGVRSCTVGRRGRPARLDTQRPSRQTDCTRRRSRFILWRHLESVSCQGPLSSSTDYQRSSTRFPPSARRRCPSHRPSSHALLVN